MPKKMKTTIAVIVYDERHGGAYDRGSADYYYGRGRDPHYYVGDSLMSDRVDLDEMDEEEVDAYDAGYANAESFGDRKNWR
jgi:hypothetical protein